MSLGYSMTYWDYVVSKWLYDFQSIVVSKYAALIYTFGPPVACALTATKGIIGIEEARIAIFAISLAISVAYVFFWLIQPYIDYYRAKGNSIIETNSEGVYLHSDSNTRFYNWEKINKMYVNKWYIYFIGKRQYISLPKSFIDKDVLVNAVPEARFSVMAYDDYSTIYS